MPIGISYIGMAWKAVINGRRSLNSHRYSVTLTGEVVDHDEDQTIYDLMCELADQIEQHNPEMEFPESFQVTLYPRP